MQVAGSASSAGQSRGMGAPWGSRAETSHRCSYRILSWNFFNVLVIFLAVPGQLGCLTSAAFRREFALAASRTSGSLFGFVVTHRVAYFLQQTQVFQWEIGVVNTQMKGALHLFILRHRFNGRKVAVILKVADFEYFSYTFNYKPLVLAIQNVHVEVILITTFSIFSLNDCFFNFLKENSSAV